MKANLFKILRYARPEWPFLALAVCSSVVQGCVFPAFSLFFSQIIDVMRISFLLLKVTFVNQLLKVFSKPAGDPLLKSEGHFWALMFLVLGGVEAITMIVQVSSVTAQFCLIHEFVILQCFFFGMSAERLTMRLRSKVFHNVMRMDATYFDMSRHSPGKITTRLATDAPNVKSVRAARIQ